jgi:glycosyltransferase involved in cell wall biosynthesis
MSTRPAISYIISAFNYAHFLGDAVDSICSGNLKPGDEILIVNDASTDNTAEVAVALAARVPQIKVLTHRHNKGCFNAGVNTAVEVAKNDVFFGLAADNLLVPDSVGALVVFMLEKKADVAAFGELRFFTTDIAKPTHSWFYAEEITLADALASHEWPGSDGNGLFTRECWLRAGRCDEFICGLDSWSFGIQQMATGSKMVTLPETYYLHRWGHESLFVRGAKEGKHSLKSLRVLLPYLDLLEEESVAYLFSPEGRGNWFENLRQRPLRVRGSELGRAGNVVHYWKPKEAFLKRLRRFIARKIAPS